jgi:pimeloyl-ACP methyl ester carboxylesterase
MPKWCLMFEPIHETGPSTTDALPRARRASNPAITLSPGHLVTPSSCHEPGCSQKQLLGPTLEQFQREAVWRTFDTGRYRCRYVLWGKGPALVFVPGLCDDPETFVLPMARLSEHFCCLAYTMPTGSGDGARLAGYDHADLVSDLLALLDHVGIQHAYLLGTSLGATVALVALHDEPERFPRGVLQAGFARRPLAWAEVLLASLARWWPGRLEQLPLRRFLLDHTLKASFAGREPEVWRYYLRHDGLQPVTSVARRALLVHQTDLRPLLPEIRQPVLLICGERDPVVFKACEQDLLRGLPNVARAEIEECGHLPQYTHPEVLSEVVRRFLS